MMRFGTVLAVTALGGVMLSGCDSDLFSREPAARTAEANCPATPKPACPDVEQTAKTEPASAETSTVRKAVRKHKVVRRRSARTYASQEESSAGLAGGRVYRRYSGSVTTGDYAYPRPPQRYEERSGGARAYSYERSESESESASMSRYEESSSSGDGYAEGSGYAYGYGGGFDPRRERYYAAGRDSRGYLTWPGKRD